MHSPPPWTRKAVQTIDLGPKLARALRESIGLGQPGGMPCKQLAREMGVDVDTVYGWAAGKGIRGVHLVRLLALMDARFANMVLTGTGIVAFKPADIERKRAEAQAEAAAFQLWQARGR